MNKENNMIEELDTFKIIKYLLKNSLLMLGIIAKSIWNTSITIISLFAYSVLLMALVSYYGIDQSSINTLLELTQFLMDNWKQFFIIFLLLNIWDSKWRFRE